jgi:hypothetical protein
MRLTSGICGRQSQHAGTGESGSAFILGKLHEATLPVGPGRVIRTTCTEGCWRATVVELGYASEEDE